MLNHLLDRIGFPVQDANQYNDDNEFDRIYPMGECENVLSGPVPSPKSYVDAIRQEISQNRKSQSSSTPNC